MHVTLSFWTSVIGVAPRFSGGFRAPLETVYKPLEGVLQIPADDPRSLAQQRFGVEVAKLPTLPQLRLLALGPGLLIINAGRMWRKGDTIAERYRVGEILGQGGIGTVYAAEHLMTGRDVAIKLLAPVLATDARLVARFLKEAKAQVKLAHRNVVEVLDMGKLDSGVPYLVLERLHGETLGELLEREQTLSPTETLEILAPIMKALGAAHALGWVHRDVKPSNIFLAKDGEGLTPKLLDFGIVKELSQPTGPVPATRTGEILGTPDYMSPEQIEANDISISAQSDIWAVGALWYRCLSGTLPFQQASALQTMLAVTQGHRAPLHEVSPELPKRLCQAIEKALQHKPADRPQSMEAYLAALEAQVQLAPKAKASPQRARQRREASLARGARASRPQLRWGAGVLGLLAAALLWRLVRPEPAPVVAALALPAEVSARRAEPVAAPEPQTATSSAQAELTALQSAAPLRGGRPEALFEERAAARAQAQRAFAARDAFEAFRKSLSERAKGLEGSEREHGRELAEVQAHLHRCESEILSPQAHTKLAAKWTLASRNLSAEEHKLALNAYRELEEISTGLLTRCQAARPRADEALPQAAAHTVQLGEPQRPARITAVKASDKVVQALDEVAQRAPSSAVVDLAAGQKLYQSALRLRQKGRRRRALSQVERALEKSPGLIVARNLSALLKQDLRDYRGARRDFNQAISAAPKDPVLYGNRGRLSLTQGRYREAIRDFDRAVRLNPAQTELLYQRGLARLKLGARSGAIQDFNSALKRAPNHADALYQRGRARLSLAQPKAAIADFDRALAARPDHERALLWRGITHMKQRRAGPAKRDLRRFLRVAPRSKHRSKVQVYLKKLGG